jgi:hypothetical protein
MYASWKYFEALFGTPDAINVPRDDDDDESAPADPPEQREGCEAHIALNSKQRPLLDRKNRLTDDASKQRA